MHQVLCKPLYLTHQPPTSELIKLKDYAKLHHFVLADTRKLHSLCMHSEIRASYNFAVYPYSNFFLIFCPSFFANKARSIIGGTFVRLRLSERFSRKLDNSIQTVYLWVVDSLDSFRITLIKKCSASTFGAHGCQKWKILLSSG